MLSKLIQFLLTGTPILPETFDKLIVRINSIHTLNIRNKHQVYSKNENRAIGKRQKVPTIKNLEQLPKLHKEYHVFESTEPNSQFKTAFYEWKLDEYSSSTLNFAPNMFIVI